MKLFTKALVVATGAIVAATTAAQAHTVGTAAAGFPQGLAHPFLGFDHLMAMVALGAWATQHGGRGRWQAPLAFLACLVGGAALALAGVSVPSVETVIAASVLVLGLLIAGAVRMPAFAVIGLAGVFGLFHGHAHGLEMPQAAPVLGYGLGFVAASAGLQLIGMAAAAALTGERAAKALRLGGAAAAASALLLIVI